MFKRFTLSLFALAALAACALGQEVIKQSTAKNAVVFAADSTDHLTGKTGLSFTITASKDGAAFASITPTVTELSNGWYKFALTTSHTDTVGTLAIHATATGADPVDMKFDVRPNVLGDTLPANTTQINGTAQTAGDAVAKLNLIAPTQTDVTTPLVYTVIAQTGAGSSTGINVTTSAVNTTGADMIFVVVNDLDGSAVLTDAKSNIWEDVSSFTSTWITQKTYKCLNPRVGTNHTFTATSNGKSPSIFVLATHGVRLADDEDQNATHTGSGTTVQPGSITPSENNCLVVSSFLCGATGAPSVSAPYTANALGLNASGNHVGGGIAYNIQTTAGATNPTWTAGGSGSLGAGIWSFKPAITGTPTISIDQFANLEVLQRSAGIHKRLVTFTGKYYGQAPAKIERAVYKLGTLKLLQQFEPIDELVCSGGTWTGKSWINEGGWLRFEARSKDQNDALIASSISTDTKFGVGIKLGVIGQSNGYRMFDSYSPVPSADDLTSEFVSGAWTTVTGNGARTLANKISAGTGLPVGLIQGCEAGTGLVYDAGSGYWLDETPGEPWPNFQTQIAASGGDLEGVFWQGCEADADNPSFDGDTLKAGFDTLYARILGELPAERNATNFTFYIGMMSTLTDSLTTDARCTAVRDALREKGDSGGGFALSDNGIDGTMVDAWHHDGPTYERMGLRKAQTFLRDLGYETKSGVGPRNLNAYRISGSADVYVQLLDLASDGIVELDGTTDGGSLTGFELSDDDFATTLTVSSTAIVGRCVKLTLSAAPADADTVKCRFAYGKSPAKTNLPYRGFNPQGDTQGLPLLPKSAFTVELRTTVDPTYYLAQSSLAKRLPVDYGYAILGGDGASLAARATSPINVLSETETSATLGTYFLAPEGFVDSGGYVLWDNGSTPAIDMLAATRGVTISPAFVDEDHEWGFDDRTQITSPNDVTESASPSVLTRMNFTEPLPEDSSIASITSVTIADVASATEPTITSYELNGTKKKVIIEFNTASATPATYTVTVKAKSIDNQTFTRKGRLVIQ